MATKWPVVVFEYQPLPITQTLIGLARILILTVGLVGHAQPELDLTINRIIDSPVQESSDNFELLSEF